MKKLIACLSFIMFVFCANAAPNPFMGNAQNQLAYYIGQGVDNGYIIPLPYHPVPFYIAQVKYSQPAYFFRMPARISMNLAETVGFGEKYGWHWNDFTIPIFFLSGDTALLYGEKWYAGVGSGMGLQAQQNERLSSKLLFEFRLFYGYHINPNWGVELYAQHFSNANTGDNNYSYAFFGVGLTHNF